MPEHAESAAEKMHPSPAKEHPAPVLSSQDAAALEIIANQQAYMASFCSTEDHDM